MLQLFFILFIFTLIEQTYNVYTYSTTCRVPSCCPHGFRSVEGLLWGAEPRFELGPTILSKPRRTLNKIH
jgi:hypothetical protein